MVLLEGMILIVEADLAGSTRHCGGFDSALWYGQEKLSSGYLSEAASSRYSISSITALENPSIKSATRVVSQPSGSDINTKSVIFLGMVSHDLFFLLLV